MVVSKKSNEKLRYHWSCPKFVLNKVTAMNHLELDTITKYKYNKRIRIQLKYTNTIKEYKYNKKLPIKQAVLALHGNKVTAMNHLDSQLGREVVEEEFRFHELLERPVLFSVMLVFCFFPSSFSA